VNSIFSVDSAHGQLCIGLQRHLDKARSSALGVLDLRETLDEAACLQQATEILDLRTLATYATAELADGLKRSRAAEGALAALLAMLAATRTLSQFSPPARDVPLSAVEAHLRAVSHAVRGSLPAPPLAHLPIEPLAALVMERATALASAHREAQAWLDATVTGAAGLPVQVRLRSDPDRIAALLNAVRVMIALGLAATFCVLGNDRSVGVAVGFTVLAFRLILPVRPERRLCRVADAAAGPRAAPLRHPGGLTRYGAKPTCTGS
jgi:hypothetical protein